MPSNTIYLWAEASSTLAEVAKYISIVLGVGLILLVGAAVFLGSTKRHVGKREAATRSLQSMVLLAVFLIGATFLESKWERAAVYLLLAVVLVVLHILRAARTRRHGRVLLHLQVSQNETSRQTVGLVFCGVGIVLAGSLGIGVLADLLEGNIASAVLGLSQILFWLVLFGTTALNLRANRLLTEIGICAAGTLFRWSNIESYRWHDKSYLLLTLHRALPGWRTGSISVELQQKEKVDDHLRQFLKQQAERATNANDS